MKNILSLKKQDGSFGNSLQTACAITTLLNFGYEKNLEKSILYLLNKQTKDGNWKKYEFHKGPGFTFGSNSVTTQ